MSEPFISEIRLVAFGFAPKGWSLADGQIMAINQNQALFSLVGTTYGGNGINTFQLPDLRGRVIVGQGSNFVMGQASGEVAHTLTTNEMPSHVHSAHTGSNSALGTTTIPTRESFNVPDVPAKFGTLYSLTGGATAGEVVAPSGGSEAHDNMQPYLVLNYIIALVGIFPSRN